MIIRRAIDVLGCRDWASVAVETVVVEIGVFIGMQASNWNEDCETDKCACASLIFRPT